MVKLSPAATVALAGAYAKIGPWKGRLKASAPKSGTPAHAAWHGAMLSCNPYRAGIGSLMLMSAEHRAIAEEVAAFFDALPAAERIAAERNRAALEAWGVW